MNTKFFYIIVFPIALGLSACGAPQPIEDSENMVSEGSDVSGDDSEVGVVIIETLTDDQGATMALVPAGPFEMGSNDGDDDEQPVHVVNLDAFYIDIYEVTNSQYAVCADLSICDSTTDTTAFESSYSRRIYFGNDEYADFPVIYASWYEAQQYCEWRGRACPQKPSGRRLPGAAWKEKPSRGETNLLYVSPAPRTAPSSMMTRPATILIRGKLAATAQMGTAYTIWQAMCGNGSVISTMKIIMLVRQTAIPRDL